MNNGIKGFRNVYFDDIVHRYNALNSDKRKTTEIQLINSVIILF